MPRLVAMLTLMLTACGAAAEPSRQAAETSAGSSAEIREVTAAQFTKIRESYKGKPLVVNFWASWCTPCEKEMPLLVAAAKRLNGRVNFLGVNVRDDAASAGKFVARNQIPFRNVSDPKGAIMSEQRLAGLPVTKFYGSESQLVFVSAGELKAKDLEDRLDELLRVD